MDTYSWFLIFLKADFDLLDIPSKTYTINLEGIGQKDILVTKGNYYSFLYDEVFLSHDLNSASPFYFEDYAIYLNADGEFYLGIKNES